MPALLACPERVRRRRADLEFRVEKWQQRASDKACTQLEGKKRATVYPYPTLELWQLEGGYCGMAGGQDLPHHLLPRTSHRPCLSSQKDIIVHMSLKSILRHNHAENICEEKMEGGERFGQK